MGRRPLVGAVRAALTLALGVLLVACGGGSSLDVAGGDGAEAAAEDGTLILATTTSTRDSGLLDVLLPAFTAATGWDVTPLAVGTGQALELGARGEADVLLVHAPAAERELVATGTTGRRLLVMHNDFLLVGPASDPAMVEGLPVSDALRQVAAVQAVFVSRGDGSGTETKELALWEQAGSTPAGGWYQSTGQGMGATLRVASEKAGYTLTDRATYLTQRDSLELEPLVEGDAELLNLYHVIEMTTEAGSRVQVEGSAAFADWIVGPEAQRMIGEFGSETYARPLFTPDAGRTEKQLVG